jgi:hypothetical protein
MAAKASRNDGVAAVAGVAPPGDTHRPRPGVGHGVIAAFADGVA